MKGLKKGKCLLGIVLGFLVIFSISFNSFAADVDVYAEGAYTDTNLVIYIYADVNTMPILSFGIRIEYPLGLTFTNATKNESVWFFGDGATNYNYMDPINTDPSGTTPGNVLIIGGKLDTSNPTGGVDGSRVLLGTVEFSHSGVTDFSGVILTYGRGDGTGDYKNFVATNSTIFDGGGVSFAMEIHERGDANGDDAINVADMSAVRYLITNGGIEYPWMDCNDDGDVNVADMSCIRYIITH